MRSFLSRHAGSLRKGAATDVPLIEDVDDFRPTSQQAILERRRADEEDLYQFALRQSQGKGPARRERHREPRFSKDERECLASLIVHGPGEGLTFAEKVAARAKEKGVAIPECLVEYKHLAVRAKGRVGANALPTLTRAAGSTFQKVLPHKARKLKEFNVLDDVSGVLRPGRMTLLLGPPASGKTTFLKLLAGRLRAGKKLTVAGDVRYNGAAPSTFVLERTAAYIDQDDVHIAAYPVGAMLKFAWRCQQGQPEGTAGLSRRNLAPAAKDASHGAEGATDAASPIAQRSGSDSNSAAALPGPTAEGAEAAAPARKSAKDSDELGGVSAAGAVDLSFLDTGHVPRGGLSGTQWDALIRFTRSTDLRVDVVLKFLGLWHCRNTAVGSEAAPGPGVSPGERHRVTAAEVLVGPRRLLLMDEISTSLDSATLHSIVSTLAMFTQMQRLNSTVALAQPPPEIIALFADLILLSEGTVVYHGPVSGVLDFLLTCGFACPPRKDLGSFLQQVTTPTGQLEFATDALRAEKGLPSRQALRPVLAGEVPSPYDGNVVSVKEMAQRFWASDPHGCAMAAQLQDGASHRGGAAQSLVATKYALKPLAMLRVVCARQLELAMKQRTMNIGRAVQVVILALLIGTLWLQLTPALDNARSFFAAAFVTVMFIAMGQTSQTAIVQDMKPVFLKQRDNFFYHGAALAVGFLWCTVPFAILEAILFSAFIYFLVGFTYAAGAFFTFCFILLLTMWAFAAWIRSAAAVAPSKTAASAMAALLLFVVVTFAGFSLPRDLVPPWFIWAFYLSPLSWALQAIVINEMTQPRWQAPYDSAGSATIGEVALQSFSFRTDRQWIWWGCLFLVGTTAAVTALTALVLQLIKPPHSGPVVADAEALREFKAEAEERRRKLQAELQADGANTVTFTPVTITFIDLEYFVPTRGKEGGSELQLLRGITGSVRPGELCALMGGSGAGKTTLMDVIAQRKTVGRPAGQLLLNGHPVARVQRAWSRNLGYVEQMDIHSPQLTVYESLAVSAQLRLPRGTSRAAMQHQVASTLQLVHLLENMDSMVGKGGGVGLSSEQRKRLTIAVELVANPAAVFMDEPTSGLDARAAAVVISSVKSVAQSGRTVMVVVHQPSVSVFMAFDTLLLLARGGRTVYFGALGPHAQHLVAFLATAPGVTAPGDNVNPAAWMLEVAGGSMAGKGDYPAEKAVDFPARYAESDLAAENRAAADAAAAARNSAPPLHVDTRHAQPWGRQVAVLSRKFRKVYWRKPDYNLMRFVIVTVIGLILGTAFLNTGELPEPARISDVQAVMGVLYTTVSFVGMVNFVTSMPVMSQERTVYYREHAAGMYSAFTFVLASSSVELPYIVAQTIVYSPITFFLIGFTNEGGWRFWYYALMIFLTIFFYIALGQALAYLTGSIQNAGIIFTGLNFVFNIFNGFTRPYPEMPVGWQWFNRVIPTTWILYGLGVTQLDDSETTFVYPSGRRTTVSQFVKDKFGYGNGFAWFCTAVVGAYVILLRLVSAAALRYLSFVKR